MAIVWMEYTPSEKVVISITLLDKECAVSSALHEHSH